MQPRFARRVESFCDWTKPLINRAFHTPPLPVFKILSRSLHIRACAAFVTSTAFSFLGNFLVDGQIVVVVTSLLSIS
jgi:hypothetical protein